MVGQAVQDFHPRRGGLERGRDFLVGIVRQGGKHQRPRRKPGLSEEKAAFLIEPLQGLAYRLDIDDPTPGRPDQVHQEKGLGGIGQSGDDEPLIPGFQRPGQGFKGRNVLEEEKAHNGSIIPVPGASPKSGKFDLT